MKWRRILHAGWWVECGKTQILFDPIFETPFSVNCHPFPAIAIDDTAVRSLRVDAVFISHFHDDHCSLESLDRLPRQTPIYLYCLHDDLFELIRALGFSQVRALTLDVPVSVGEIVVTPRRAMDWQIDALLEVRGGGVKVLNVVDAVMDPVTLKRLAREAPWDAVIWPFQPMRETAVIAPTLATLDDARLPDEWWPELQALAPRILVPGSCQFIQEAGAWYRQHYFPVSYAAFAHAAGIRLPLTRVWRLDPGQGIELTPHDAQPLAAVPWIQRLDADTVDYEFDPAIPVPTTQAVAALLPPVDASVRERLRHWCEHALPAALENLDHADSPHFDAGARWLLTVVFADEEWRYGWRVSSAGTQRLQSAGDDWQWSTDIPAIKLWAALEAGETLTSLYLRIHDRTDDAHRESLGDWSLDEDPLVRVLFEADAFSYQRAQWRRLRARADD